MIVATDCRSTPARGRLERRVVGGRTRRGEGVEVAVVDDPGVGERGQVAGDALDRALVLLALDDDAHRVGVLEDPLDLVGRGGLVDRDGHGAGGPQGEVGEGPLVAGAAHDADGAARGDARREEALGQRVDLVAELLGGEVAPAGAVAHGEQRRVTGSRGGAGRGGRRGCPRSWSGRAWEWTSRATWSPSTGPDVVVGPGRQRRAVDAPSTVLRS